MNQILKRTLVAVAIRNKVMYKQEMAFPDADVNQIALRSKAYPKNLRSYRQFGSLSEFLECYVQSSYDLFETCYDSVLGNKFNFVFHGFLLLNNEQKEQLKLYVQHIWGRIEEDELQEEEIRVFLHNLYQISLVFDQDVFDIGENLNRFVASYDFFAYSKEVRNFYQKKKTQKIYMF